MITDYFFWFAQPSTLLNNYDRWTIYLFAFLLIAGMALWVVRKFTHHPVVKKLLSKLVAKDLAIGVTGLIWAGMRYENTPIFAKRIWAGLIILAFVVWLVYVLKYLVMNFFQEKKEYDDYQIKSKYIPGNKK